MNVRQLIEELQKYDPESLVCMESEKPEEYRTSTHYNYPWVMRVESSVHKFTYSLDNELRRATVPFVRLRTNSEGERLGPDDFMYFIRVSDPIVEIPDSEHAKWEYSTGSFKHDAGIELKTLDVKSVIDNWMKDLTKGR